MTPVLGLLIMAKLCTMSGERVWAYVWMGLAIFALVLQALGLL